MRFVLLILAFIFTIQARAQQRTAVPVRKADATRQIVSLQSGPFADKGKVLQDALDQKESLRGVESATVQVNVDDAAKQYLSPEEASAVISRYLFTGKFKPKSGNTDEMPLLKFSVSVNKPPATGFEVVKAITIRMGFVHALAKRPSDLGSKVLLATTFDDVYIGYGRNVTIIQEQLREGLKALAQEFATAFDDVN